ncbi:PREDICTED: acetylajmalan esterase-like [Nelumbo nucifera]|uniref:Acetylajmalan esterase-like n=2 Tax=Nelumbo nucifera TaxID=4432 RepID=A0A1U7ZSX4_NELNU|nr:PREDICTED: acetylajmalan esterase-like [Nelumbo nucifera]DAD43047.1 TPA_asm: hypothetical protein HUJ06_001277 [Nelumbo nucifera]
MASLLSLILIIYSFFLSSFTSASQHKICPFDAVYQFGDSLSDTGNSIRSSFGVNSSASRLPYGETYFRRPTGRWSDGLLAIDYINLALGLPLLNPYLERNASFSHGVNFAVAGSTALNNTFFMKRNLFVSPGNIPLSVQLNWFKTHLKSTCRTLSGYCSKRLTRALVFMGEIGTNDYFYSFGGKPIEETRTYVPYVVRAIKEGVREVVRAGAVNVIVPGIPPIGCVPTSLTFFQSNDTRSYDDMGCLKDLNEFAMYHNTHLHLALKDLRREYPQAAILYADFYAVSLSIIRRAMALGFKKDVLLKACCGVGGDYNFSLDRPCGSPGVPVCSKPAQYLSWDGTHLTQEANKKLADWMIDNVLTKIPCK